VAEALRDLIFKCVEKRPDARWQSPREVLAALESIKV